MTGLATFAPSVTEPYRDFRTPEEITQPIGVAIAQWSLILQRKMLEENLSYQYRIDKGLKITHYEEHIP
jgi:hypothetical protein